MSNILTDVEKQKTFYLFLGEFIPDIKKPQNNLWDTLNIDKLETTKCKCVLKEKRKSIFPKISKKEKLMFSRSKIEKLKSLNQSDFPIIIEEEKKLIK